SRSLSCSMLGGAFSNRRSTWTRRARIAAASPSPCRIVVWLALVFTRAAPPRSASVTASTRPPRSRDDPAAGQNGQVLEQRLAPMAVFRRMNDEVAAGRSAAEQVRHDLGRDFLGDHEQGAPRAARDRARRLQRRRILDLEV